eukprot:scaffold45332_cov24-Tisochrysis_lutea.AAC.1
MYPVPCAQVKHGETFVSETDTEVIPKLCKFIFQGLRKTEGEKVPFSKVSWTKWFHAFQK